MNWIHAKTEGKIQAQGLGVYFATKMEKEEKIQDQDASFLLREFIQNALDAKSNKSKGPVRVSVREITIRRNILNKYGIDGLEDLQVKSFNKSEKAGKKFNESLYRDNFSSEEVNCLVMEDFGTTGLRGSFLDDSKNDLQLFIEYEGITSKKGGNTSGSQGIGKNMFNRSSGIGTIMFMSTRDELPKSVFSGISLYDGFKEGNVKYSGVSYLTNHPLPTIVPFISEDLQGFTNNNSLIEDFRNDFKLTRTKEETGLSVVIPCLKPFANKDSILREIVKDFDFAILGEKLNFDFIEKTGQKIELTHKNAIQFVQDKNQKFFLEFINEFNNSHNDDPDFELDAGDKYMERPKQVTEFIEEHINSEEISRLKSKLESNENIKIRIKLSVEKKDEFNEKQELSKEGFFDLYIKKIESDEFTSRTKIKYYRGPLYIENNGSNHTQNDCLVIVSIEGENPLADLLVNSENPAHDAFIQDTRDSEYQRVPTTVSLIKKSSSDITNLIFEPEVGEIHNGIFDKYFTAPKNVGTGPIVDPPGSPDRSPLVIDWSDSIIDYDLGEIHIYFNDLKNKKRPLREDEIITIKVGYRTSKTGTTIQEDINLASKYFDDKFEADNCEIVGRGGKEIQISPNFEDEFEDTFSLVITGLDKNRIPMFEVERLRNV
tara:strand:- start:1041 stop:3014 length:1974 start_codon:yes stop_codon:yes gene_type:complete